VSEPDGKGPVTGESDADVAVVEPDNDEKNKPTAGGLTAKDWITITLSSLALVISASSAYYNILRQQDDLRVVIGEAPGIFYDTNARNIAIIGGQGLTFINSGNRAAAIMNVSLVIATPLKDENSPKCSTTSTYELRYLFEPFVMKPGELTVKSLQDMPIGSIRPSDPRVRLLPHELFDIKLHDHIIICLFFEVETPSSFNAKVEVILYDTNFLSEKEFDETQWPVPVKDGTPPAILIQKTGSIFGL
jgi:hypothetical protein